MNFPRRILHVIPSVSPKRGGPGEAVISMVAALNQCGVEAEIATTNDDGPGTCSEPLYELMTHRDVPVRFFPRFSPPLRALRDYAWSPSFRLWLRHHIARYDLLHVHGVFSSLPSTAMRLALMARVPYLNRPLGQLGHWPLRQSAVRKKIHYALVEGRYLQHAAALHFTSDAEQHEAANLHLALRSAVIPHGVHLPALIPEAARLLRGQLRLPREEKIVLFLGRLHPKKASTFFSLPGRGYPRLFRLCFSPGKRNRRTSALCRP